MRITIVPLVLLAACSGQPTHQTAPVNIGDAAEEARESVDHYAAVHAAAAPSPVPTRAGNGTPAPIPTSSTPAPAANEADSEAPYAPDSAQSAAEVVRRYYTLIGQGRYRQAWRLWEDRGRASGMTADAFAAGVAEYRDHHADVGAPGRVDAGAGQRYVTVPVTIRGRLRQGDRAVAMDGQVTLHRAADIDGATAEQKSWRISAADLRPARPD